MLSCWIRSNQHIVLMCVGSFREAPDRPEGEKHYPRLAVFDAHAQ